MLPHSLSARQRASWFFGLAVLLLAGSLTFHPAARAQQPPGGSPSATPAAPAAPAAGGGQDPAPSSGAAAPARKEPEGINFFVLLVWGGWFMVPIAGMSLLGVTFAIERWLALRRSRLMPEGLLTQLDQLSSSADAFDARRADDCCQRFPCAAAAVIRAMLARIGRPHSEVEHAVAEASEREAERAYANVRWLNLCTAVAPLMGLLGTVWGMIVSFHQTTQLAQGQDRAQQLASGIYIALVTTLAGLMVAIPTAILSHFYETRIIAVFHEIDELLFNLLPLVERYEGSTRFAQNSGEDPSPTRPAGRDLQPAANATGNRPGANIGHGS